MMELLNDLARVFVAVWTGGFVVAMVAFTFAAVVTAGGE